LQSQNKFAQTEGLGLNSKRRIKTGLEILPKAGGHWIFGREDYCLVIPNLHENLGFDLYSWRKHNKWHRITWYFSKRQNTPQKVDRKVKRELLSCHSCLGCSKERLRPVFVTDAISTSHAFLPKLFSSFIDGKVKFVNGIIVCSTKRFPVSWTADVFDRTTAPRPETDDHNRLVLNVPVQQSVKSEAFFNKPRLTLGFPPFLAEIIKKRQCKAISSAS